MARNIGSKQVVFANSSLQLMLGCQIALLDPNKGCMLKVAYSQCWGATLGCSKQVLYAKSSLRSMLRCQIGLVNHSVGITEARMPMATWKYHADGTIQANTRFH